MIHWHYLAWAAAAVCFAFTLLGYFGAGMASRAVTREDLKFPRMCALVGAVLIVLTLTACKTTEPGVEIRYVDRPVMRVQSCLAPEDIPEPPVLGKRPSKDARVLADLLLAKWREAEGYFAIVDPLLRGCSQEPR